MIEAYLILVSKRMLLDVVNSILLLLTCIFNISRKLLHKNFPNYVPSLIFLSNVVHVVPSIVYVTVFGKAIYLIVSKPWSFFHFTIFLK